MIPLSLLKSFGVNRFPGLTSCVCIVYTDLILREIKKIEPFEIKFDHRDIQPETLRELENQSPFFPKIQLR